MKETKSSDAVRGDGKTLSWTDRPQGNPAPEPRPQHSSDVKKK